MEWSRTYRLPIAIATHPQSRIDSSNYRLVSS